MQLPASHPLVAGAVSQSPIVQALNGVQQRKPPIWLMRQAGRSLPEYRKVREGIPMLDSCLRPELAAEITLQPVRRHGVDAAIFFSDIVIPMKLAGVDVSIVPTVGPVLTNPVQSRAAFRQLPDLDPSALSPITEAIKLTIAELGSTPLLGFGGAPFTLASYLIEGKPSKEIPVSRAMMKEDPQLWSDILQWCARITAEFLRAQILAGAVAVQLFDSWAGRLTADEYAQFAAPHSKSVMEAIKDLPVPRIHFGVGTKSILTKMHGVGATVIGVDSETSLTEAAAILHHKVPLQGNVDPELLLGEWPALQRAIDVAIAEGRSAPSHVLNLGHGVLPESDPDLITRMVDYVHQD